MSDSPGAVTAYAAVLASRWRWLVWGILGSLVVTTAVLVAAPTHYRCTSTVFVRTPGDVSTVSDGGDSYARGRARTYAAMVTNTGLTARVAAGMGSGVTPGALADGISATNPADTALIDVTVSGPTPGDAQRTATILLDQFASLVADLESVPGSLVPRAELVVVNRPDAAVRIVAWGLPVPAVLAGAALVGFVLAGLCVVVADAATSRPASSVTRAGRRSERIS